jgi:hypothetical protein
MPLISLVTYELPALLLAAFAALPSPDEAQPAARSVYAVCSAPSAASATGRQWAQVVGSPLVPTLCQRELLGGEAPAEFPDCFEVGRALGCREFGPDRG